MSACNSESFGQLFSHHFVLRYGAPRGFRFGETYHTCINSTTRMARLSALPLVVAVAASQRVRVTLDFGWCERVVGTRGTGSCLVMRTYTSASDYLVGARLRASTRGRSARSPPGATELSAWG